eukprot:gb/GECG01005918.1/.p1 GENE.gb/GECG01005918.1/~~gb/GECG01005918.1/.p1  ORF type:complete len:364 (+),score=35.57 gb/GECG01005918.1/:1-1092(+)
MAAEIDPPIVVVGAGIIGLSSAYYLLKYEGYRRVLCISNEFSPRTTSDGAGAIWEPYTVEGTDEDTIDKWAKETLDFEYGLVEAGLSRETGVYEVQGQQYYKEPLEETPYWSQSTKSFRELNSKELEEAGLRRHTTYRYGFEFATIIAESPKFLRWLENQISDLGGRFAPRHLKHLPDAIDVAIESEFMRQDEAKHAIIINCSGYGAKFLCNDESVVPVRGQVLRVFAPQVREFRIDVDKKAYVLPRLGCGEAVCGGTTDFGETDCYPNEMTSKEIWEKCAELVPELNAPNSGVLQAWVGLRPLRKSGVRIESVQAESGYHIVHNYGHGGAGHTLYWGCAKEIATLVRSVATKVWYPSLQAKL